MKKELGVWVIYDHPSDWPHHWVLRRQHVFAGRIYVDPISCLAESVEQLRANLPPGLIRWPHQTGEDPVIFESWF